MSSAGPVLSVLVICEAIALTVGTVNNYDFTTAYMAFPKYDISWNGGVQVCRDLGMDMAKVDTVEVMHALNEFFNDENYLEQYSFPFWTGLHSNSTDSEDKASKQSFFWQDCTQIGNVILWANPPDFMKNCVSIESKVLSSSTAVFKAEDCRNSRSLICERQTDNCSEFRKFTGYQALTNPANVTSLSLSCEQQYDDCQTECLNTKLSNLSCLGFTYDDNNCTLHFSVSTAAIWSRLQSPSLYTKFCFTMNVSLSREAERIYKNERIAVLGCMPQSFSYNFTGDDPGEATTSMSLPLWNKSTTDKPTSESEVYSITTIPRPMASEPTTSPTASPQSITPPTTRSPATAPLPTPAEPTTMAPQPEIQTTTRSPATAPASTTPTASKAMIPQTETPSTTGPSPILTGKGFISTDGTPAITPVDTERSTRGGSSTVTALYTETSTEFFSTAGTSDNPCPCNCRKGSTNLTMQEKEAFIGTILEKLSVQKANLSSNQRKYVSAGDPRPSSQGIGCIGIVFLTVAIGGIILLDFPFLLSEIKHRLVCRTDLS